MTRSKLGNQPGDRIKLARENSELKLNQEGLAKLCGWNGSARISNYEKNTREPNLSDIEKISKVLKVRPSWLAFNEGKNPFDPNAEKIPEAHCPILPWGKVMDWLSGNREAAVSEMQGTTYSYNASHNSYALRIETPSMLSDESEKPSFRVGTIIIVEPEKKPKTGSFVIVSIDGKEPILRQYMKEGSDQMVTRMDTGHDLQYLSENDKILGVVVAHIDLTD